MYFKNFGAKLTEYEGERVGRMPAAIPRIVGGEAGSESDGVLDTKDDGLVSMQIVLTSDGAAGLLWDPG